MYRRSVLAGAILAAAVISMPVTYAKAQQFNADLVGFNEAPLSIFSSGQGTLALNLNQKLQMATYTLTYSGLSAPITQSHIHLGERHQAGGIFVFLCGTPTNPGPSGTAACAPGTSGTVTGTITPSLILGLSTQGFPATFGAFVTAITSQTETTYANVHTTNFPAGEIRGQILLSQNQQ
jgi:hypothetical protein